MSNHSLDFDIRVGGKTIKQYTRNGKFFVEAKHGSEYSVHVSNHRVERVLVVCTVDGINVLNGQAGASRAGYVVNGYSSVDIKGFRTSNDSVNAFKFSTKDNSYAAKSDETGGDTSNCGVIGIQVYAEKLKPVPKPQTIIEHHYHEWPNYPLYPKITWTSNTSDISHLGAGDFMDGQLRCFNATTSLPNNSKSSKISATYSVGLSSLTPEPAPTFDMGTEWSKTEIADKVHDVEFETGRLLTTFKVYYASRQALESMGVQFIKQTQVSFPDPFPTRFCKPPR